MLVVYRRKVAIIGAGMAGLGAARTLTEQGCRDFIVLEAQNRPGGRVNTFEWNNHILELGAQFIHGVQNPLFELANKHQLLSDVKTEEGLGIYIRDDGTIIDEFLVKLVDFHVGRILSECEDFVRATDYPNSVGEYLETEFDKYLDSCVDDSSDIKRIKRELFDWHVRFIIIDNSCCDLRQLSAKNWGRYVCLDDQAHVNFKRGYNTLVQILIDDLPKDSLLLSKPVIEIKCNDNTVDKPIEIVCQDNTKVFCDHVIITVSLGVLKSNLLTITPPLPRNITNIINNDGFYGIVKVFLIFDNRWWGDVEGYQLIWSEDAEIDDDMKWTRYIQGFDSVLNEPNVLLGWVGGPGVVEMENLSIDDVGQHCMRIIRRFVRDRQIPEPIKVFRSEWMSNPWIRGSYSHITPNCDDPNLDIGQLSHPVFIGDKMRILLAGEAVHSSHYSTTHGAFESGQEQAKILCESFKQSY